LNSIIWLLENNLIERPIHIQFVMGSLTGMSATPSMLIYLLQKAREDLGDFT
jgi:hypothetical protein